MDVRRRHSSDRSRDEPGGSIHAHAGSVRSLADVRHGCPRSRPFSHPGRLSWRRNWEVLVWRCCVFHRPNGRLVDARLSVSSIGAICPGGVSLSAFTFSGPTLSAGGFTFAPGNFMCCYDSHGGPTGFTSDALSLSNFAGATNWQPLLRLGFNRVTHELSAWGPVVSISVPEPSSFVMLSSALFAFVAWSKRRSRHS